MPLNLQVRLDANGVPVLEQASMGDYRNAIAKVESAGSGDYAAVGPKHRRLGRALGRYQIMEANLPEWSRQALGRSVTPQEFMASPQLQDAIFDYKFGSYVKKFGNPQDAASAWLTGQPLSKAGNRKDVFGTNAEQYVNKFNAALGTVPYQGVNAGSDEFGGNIRGNDGISVIPGLVSTVGGTGAAAGLAAGLSGGRMSANIEDRRNENPLVKGLKDYSNFWQGQAHKARIRNIDHYSSGSPIEQSVKNAANMAQEANTTTIVPKGNQGGNRVLSLGGDDFSDLDRYPEFAYDGKGFSAVKADVIPFPGQRDRRVPQGLGGGGGGGFGVPGNVVPMRGRQQPQSQTEGYAAALEKQKGAGAASWLYSKEANSLKLPQRVADAVKAKPELKKSLSAWFDSISKADSTTQLQGMRQLSELLNKFGF